MDAAGAWEKFLARLKMKIEWTQRYTLEAVIEQVRRCTSRLWLSEFGDIHIDTMSVRTWRQRSSEFWCPSWASLEMHFNGVIERVARCSLEAVIKRVWTCTWRLWSSECGDMHMNANFVQTWRQRSSEFRCHNWASFEMHLDTVFARVGRCTMKAWIERVWRHTWGCTWAFELWWRARLIAGDRVGRHARSWRIIERSTTDYGNEEKTNCLW
jgi:hypothetical protein